ncbi:MAG: UDP-2,4-diacetamido-2,4,6-trideoxy-beta-L-altropyranose hydrolase [Bacillota bacterium]|nr:UDP-2,4-diacetamido-2,4,6-trideoxy-beta-L-altropyranose hydrolase [Bacillota bacterium]
MLNIAIRADGSPDIGMGHIMRCLSLAEELERIGCSVYFLSNFAAGIREIGKAGLKAIELQGSDLDSSIDLKSEADLIIKLIGTYEIDVLIIDTYNVDFEYLSKLKKNVKKLVYIDDINKFSYPVDVLVNGNITGEYLNYHKYSENEMMLLGPQYNLIRGEFKNLPARSTNKEVKSMMITTGGSDPYNLSIRIPEVLLKVDELKDLKVNIVVGNMFSNKDRLHEMRKKNENIILHENVRHMSEIMLSSDLAISSGGSTLYELCACGLPTLAFIMADNQEFIAEKMSEFGYVKNLGWYNELDEKVIKDNVKLISEDCRLRKEMAIRGQTLVDAQGAKRVATSIIGQLVK